jgi:uncharacterized protein YegJ (DUF2314 family)
VLQSPNSNQLFFRVCAWFPSRPAFGCEDVWANVWKYESGSFFGAVPEGNPRIGLTNNQSVSIEASNVFDWAYMEFGKGLVGDFTARAIRGESNRVGGGIAAPASQTIPQSGTGPRPAVPGSPDG